MLRLPFQRLCGLLWLTLLFIWKNCFPILNNILSFVLVCWMRLIPNLPKKKIGCLLAMMSWIELAPGTGLNYVRSCVGWSRCGPAMLDDGGDSGRKSFCDETSSTALLYLDPMSQRSPHSVWSLSGQPAISTR